MPIVSLSLRRTQLDSLTQQDSTRHPDTFQYGGGVQDRPKLDVVLAGCLVVNLL
jgi:hypothetical protein